MPQKTNDGAFPKILGIFQEDPNGGWLLGQSLRDNEKPLHNVVDQMPYGH